MYGLIRYSQYLTLKEDSLFLNCIIYFKEVLLVKIFSNTCILKVFLFWYNNNNKVDLCNFMKKRIFDKYVLNSGAVCGLPEGQAARLAGDLQRRHQSA